MDAKVVIRAMLLSSKKGVRLAEFRTQYRSLAGQDLDMCGHASVQELLRDMPDAAYVRLVNGELVAFGRESTATAHICSLIKRQKSNGNCADVSNRRVQTSEVNNGSLRVTISNDKCRGRRS